MMKKSTSKTFLVQKFKENRLNIVLGILALLIFWGAYQFFFRHSNVFSSTEEFKAWILSYGNFSIIMFVIIQVIQVVIFFIPGEVTQVAGGYIFGAFWGTILSSAGILLGSALAYLFAKYFAKKHVLRMIEKKNLKRFKKVLDKGSNKIIILVIYLIPGIPKDILVYVAGVSEVTLIDFIIYSSIGRFPWILVSTYFGHGINNENYLSIILIAIVASLLFLVGILKGQSIIDYFHKLNRNREW